MVDRVKEVEMAEALYNAYRQESHGTIAHRMVRAMNKVQWEHDISALTLVLVAQLLGGCHVSEDMETFIFADGSTIEPQEKAVH